MGIMQTETASNQDVQQNPAERRKHDRAELLAEIGLYSATNFFTGFTEDLSEGGLFVATHMLQPLGTEISLNFALPNGHEISVHGVVRWLRDPHDTETISTPPGMGVQFVNLAPDDLEVIREFIRLREPMFYEA